MGVLLIDKRRQALKLFLTGSPLHCRFVVKAIKAVNINENDTNTDVQNEKEDARQEYSNEVPLM